MIKIKKLFAAFFVFFAATTAYAQNIPIDITVNEKIIKTDTMPIIENGAVLAPIRAVSSALGCENIAWDENSRTATLKSGSDEIKIVIGENKAYVNGAAQKLNTKAKIIDNRTYVPVRFIAENFDAQVSWEPKMYNVIIYKNGLTVDTSLIDNTYTPDDLTWLAKIVNAEACGEIMNGKIGVANVVLNRVEDDNFPDTVYDVIFDSEFGIQFTPVANGTINNEASLDSFAAAKKALRGESAVGDCLYFCNPKISTNFWIINNRPFYMTIGNHDFYL